MSIVRYKEWSPNLGQRVFLAPGSHVIGRCTLGDDVGIWFGAVLRADIHEIRIGARSNVQDNAVFHLSDTHGTILGEDVVVGHGAILHACTIGDNVLVGMGSIVMDGAVIGEGSVIAAGALVPPGKTFPPHSLIVGSPAKVVRETTEAERESNRAMAAKYMRIKDEYLAAGSD